MTKEKYKVVTNYKDITAERIICALFGSTENFIAELKEDAAEKKKEYTYCKEST